MLTRGLGRRNVELARGVVCRLVDSALDSRSELNSRRNVESVRVVACRLVDSALDSRSELNSRINVESA